MLSLWFQHMRAHEDSVALQYSFYEVVTAKDEAPRALRDLRHRCLNPGLYSQHLERWLDYYKEEQVRLELYYLVRTLSNLFPCSTCHVTFELIIQSQCVYAMQNPWLEPEFFAHCNQFQF